MRYQCIARRRTQYPVRMMCRLLSVSRSGFYAWRVRPESERTKTDRELTRVIRRYHGESDGVYGSPKIRDELRDDGYHCGRHKVARLMRKAGLKGCPKRRFKVTTKPDPSHPGSGQCAAARLHRRSAERTMGVGYHVYLDTTGLVVSGGSNGSVLASHRRLVDESLDQPPPGH